MRDVILMEQGGTCLPIHLKLEGSMWDNNNKGSDAAKGENIRYVSLYKTATW